MTLLLKLTLKLTIYFISSVFCETDLVIKICQFVTPTSAQNLQQYEIRHFFQINREILFFFPGILVLFWKVDSKTIIIHMIAKFHMWRKYQLFM